MASANAHVQLTLASPGDDLGGLLLGLKESLDTLGVCSLRASVAVTSG